MKKNRSTIAIIPARGGSKGLLKKNIKLLNGKPLIAWTIEQALRTKEIDEVVVSTDCPDIAAIAKDYGALVPFLRPEILSSDVATSYSVVEHCLNFYSTELNQNFDIVAMLEPTQPLREPADLSLMCDLLVASYDNFDAVMCVGECSQHPSLVHDIAETGYLVGYEEYASKASRRQDLSVLYYPSGTFLIKTSELLSKKSFYPSRTAAYKLQRHQCFEIDDIYDFLAVENIMKYQWRL
tara:strand:- start:313 stop:1026 length:714 start_codon:yes stop_codon:yes gene_type:complete